MPQIVYRNNSSDVIFPRNAAYRVELSRTTGLIKLTQVRDDIYEE